MTDIKTSIIVMFLLVGVGVVIFTFAGDLLGSYGIELEGNFSGTQTRLENTLADTKNITEDIQSRVSEEGGITIFGGFAVLGKSALAGIKLPFKFIALATTLLTEISTAFGVPTWVFTVTIMIIVTLLIAAVLAVVLRTRI